MRFCKVKTQLKKALAIVAVACIAACFMPMRADAASSELTVSAGFYGGPYHEIKTFSYNDMCDMANGNVLTYSGMDTGNFVCISYAWGVNLKTLIDTCGIDQNSVKFLHMTTSDNYGEQTTTFTASDLLSTRYFFPNLAKKMGEDPQITDFSKENYGAGARQIPTILAINSSEFSRSEAQRIAAGGDYKEYSSGSELSAGFRYRLMYGQSAVTGDLSNGYNVQSSGKWVKAIEVQLDGSPSINVKKELISGEEGKTGSKYRLTVDVTLPSSYSYLSASALRELKQQVIDNIEVTGYDSSVVKVTGLDSNKTLKSDTCQVEIVGKGDTQLQFSYLRKDYSGTTSASASAGISGNGESNAEDPKDPDETKDPEETKNPDDPKKPDDPKEPDTPTDPSSPDSGNDGGKGGDTNNDSGSKSTGGNIESNKNSGLRIVDNKVSAALDRAQKAADRNNKKSSSGGWIQFDMQNDVVDFSADDTNGLMGFTGAMAAGLLAAGGWGEAFVFRRSIGAKALFKKIFK